MVSCTSLLPGPQADQYPPTFPAPTPHSLHQQALLPALDVCQLLRCSQQPHTTGTVTQGSLEETEAQRAGVPSPRVHRKQGGAKVHTG